QACLPFLKQASNPHILTMSPPLAMQPKWFASHAAYTLSKYGMSMLTLGMAEEFRAAGIGINALWPRTIIATAALRLVDEGAAALARTPEIVADAAHWILTRDSRTTTGNFYIDEAVLRQAGETDFDHYLVTPGAKPMTDLFVEE